MKESDMYQPIKTLFEQLGFEVKAEVKDVDVTAVKDNDVVLIEMKNALNIKLLYQACQRQRISEYVYIAIPKPTSKIIRSKGFKEKMYLVKRLHLGLIFVGNEATIEFDPKEFDMTMSKRRAKKKKELHLREFSNRFLTSNIGGVTKTKIMTAYKQQTLLIASELFEPKSTKELRSIYGFDKTSSILQKNYYMWFERVDRGVYQLTEKGRKEVSEYNEYIDEMKSAL